MVNFDLILSVEFNIKEVHHASYTSNKYAFKEDVSSNT